MTATPLTDSPKSTKSSTSEDADTTAARKELGKSTIHGSQGSPPQLSADMACSSAQNSRVSSPVNKKRPHDAVDDDPDDDGDDDEEKEIESGDPEGHDKKKNPQSNGVHVDTTGDVPESDSQSSSSTSSSPTTKSKSKKNGEREKKRARDTGPQSTTQISSLNSTTTNDTEPSTITTTTTTSDSTTTTTPAPPVTSPKAFATSGFARLASSTTSPFGSLAGNGSSTSRSLFGSSTSTSSPSPFSSVPSTSLASSTTQPSSTNPDTKTSMTSFTPKLSFGNAASSSSPFATASSSLSNGSPSLFGSQSSGFSSLGGGTKLTSFAKPGASLSTKPAKPFGAPESDDEEDESDEDGNNRGDDEGSDGESSTETNEVDEKKEKKLRLQAVEVNSGENDEATVLQVRAKMFFLVKAENGATSWKERGAGMLKINAPKESVDIMGNGAVVPGSFDASGLYVRADDDEQQDRKEDTPEESDEEQDDESDEDEDASEREDSKKSEQKKKPLGDEKNDRVDEEAGTSSSSDSRKSTSPRAETKVKAPSRKVVRLLMRQDSTHRVVLNTPIIPAIKFTKKETLNSNGVIFAAVGEDGKLMTVYLKMSAANTNSFLNEVELIQRELQSMH